MKVKLGRILPVVALIAMAAFQTTSADAGTIYSIVNPSNNQSGYTVSGQIEIKNGTSFGALNTNDISSWSWSATNGTNTYAASSTDSGASADNYDGLSVRETGIYLAKDTYNFSLRGSATNYPQLQWGNGGYPNFQMNTEEFNAEILVYAPAFETDATYGWQIASPSPTSVPEIDPNSLGSVLALVLGSLGLLERRRPKAA